MELKILLLISVVLVISDCSMPDKSKITTYAERRSLCAGWRCKDIPKENILERDICLHQCASPECFELVYGDIEGMNPQFANQIEELIERERRKQVFVECIEGPKVKKSYSELRSDCSKWKCKDIEKGDKFQRDLCLHECINGVCYYQVYGDVHNNIPNFKSKDEERALRENKKTQFIDCLKNQKKHDLQQVDKSYTTRRSECAGKVCKDVDKDDKLARDFCLHKCVNYECWSMVYGLLDIYDREYTSKEEEEAHRLELRTNFIECFEKGTISKQKKSYQDKRSECSSSRCKDLPKTMKLERDMCVHKCIDKLCYDKIYYDLEEQDFVFSSIKEQEKEREIRKNDFKICYEGKDTEKKKPVTYSSKRSECAAQCKNIDKQNKFQRDICIHKCVQFDCFESIYKDIEFTLDSYLQNFEEAEIERQKLKSLFIDCSKKYLTGEKEKQKTYAEERSKCSEHDCSHYDKTDIWGKELCIHRCISWKCYDAIYTQEKISSIQVMEDETQKELIRTTLKSEYISCFERDAPKSFKTYSQKRSDCAEQRCINIPKENKFLRDICIHRCVNDTCFFVAYGEIDEFDIEKQFPNEEQREDERIERKNEFILCVEKDQPRENVNYVIRRGECSSQRCNHISKEEVFQREMCLHECISRSCFYQLYSDIIGEEIEQEKALLDLESKKKIFIACVEGGTRNISVKNYAQQRSYCSDKFCKNIPKTDKLERDICIHKCADLECYQKIYTFDLQNLNEEELQVANQNRENLKNEFISCYQNLYSDMISNEPKSYPDKRSECSSKKCQDVPRELTFERDLCLHQCIHKACHDQVYDDLQGNDLQKIYKDQDEYEWEKETRKQNFIKCYEATLPPEILQNQKQGKKEKSYQQARSECAFQQCKEIEHSDKFERDKCLHKCMSGECYWLSYADIEEAQEQEIYYERAQDREIDRITRKKSFMSCFQEFLTDKRPKTYKDLRSECSQLFCKEIDKDDKLKRDLCLHKCVNEECYTEVYGLIEYDPKKFQSIEEEDQYRDLKKFEFIQCVERDIPKVYKTYAQRRSICSESFCKEIPKNETFRRDICLHKCVSQECFGQIYEGSDIQEFDTQEEEEQERFTKKKLFVECVEQNVTKKEKTYSQKRSEISNLLCKHISQDDKISRDICIHEFVHYNCFQEVYSPHLDEDDLIPWDQREVLKMRFVQCYEKAATPEKQQGYTQLRQKCSLVFCKEIPKEQKFARDFCLHQCINQLCFEQYYSDIPQDSEMLQQNTPEVDQDRQARKKLFIQCVEKDLPQKSKTYAELRSYCSLSCKHIQKDKIFERDMCIHQCIDESCYLNIYTDYDGKENITFESTDQEKIFRKQLKTSFQQCLQLESTKAKSYTDLRSECSVNFCKDISKEQKLERDLCLHQCINQKCYDEIYKEYDPNNETFYNDTDLKEQQRNIWKDSFIECIEKQFPSVKKSYASKRSQCSQKACKDLDPSKIFVREMCLHRCIDEQCYNETFGDLNSDEITFENQEKEEQEKRFRKRAFIDCFQQEQEIEEPEDVEASYSEMRSICSSRRCKDIDKKFKLERDICLHKCVSRHCFIQVYSDIQYQLPKYVSQAEMDKDQQERKETFIDCYETQSGIFRNQDEQYGKLRGHCAEYRCRHIPKENLLERDLCLHKCISHSCFYEVYSKIPERFSSFEEENQEREERKKKFITCVEKDLPKKKQTYGDKRSICSPSCIEISKDDMLRRDLCLHKCISQECYNKIYGDIQVNGIPLYSSAEVEKRDREIRKAQFIGCTEDRHDQPPPQGDNYNELRADCSNRFCNHIDRENQKFLRDLCLHECVNKKCYNQVYGDIDVENVGQLRNRGLEEVQRVERKQQFIDCVNNHFVKLSQPKGYDDLRSSCGKGPCSHIPKSDRFQRDYCIHKCISKECFQEAYGDIVEVNHENIQQYDLQREQRKNSFIDCFNKGAPRKKFNYASKRSQCAERECQSIPKEQAFERDVCLHKCVSENCWKRVYGDMEKKQMVFTTDKEKESQRKSRKQEFIDCYQDEIGVTKQQPELILDQSKTYAEKRSECSAKRCKHIQKTKKLQRDMCVHKCIDKNCYFSVYGDIDGKQIPTPLTNEAELDRVQRKDEFLQCAERGFTQKEKSYGQRRSDCASRSCANIDRNNRFARDLCIHRCISDKCYLKHYGDLDGKIISFPSQEREEKERQQRKSAFIKCVEKETPWSKKSYIERRQECIENYCQSIPEDQKYELDVCSHKCASKTCFNKIYESDQVPTFQDQKYKEADRKKKKNKFIECVTGQVQEEVSKQISDVAKPYQVRRSNCAQNRCAFIDKTKKLQRDMCLHKCVSKDCYYEVYSDIDKADPVYTSPQAEEEDREWRRKAFITCTRKETEAHLGTKMSYINLEAFKEVSPYCYYQLNLQFEDLLDEPFEHAEFDKQMNIINSFFSECLKNSQEFEEDHPFKTEL